jgi:RNA polymerase sigma-70 factor (ECF subfamily)
MSENLFLRNKIKTDEELAEMFRKDKDMEILGELFHRYMDMIMGLCMKYFKNTVDSEDAVMEIFEVLARRLPNHQVKHFKSWIYSLSSNHCLDILRKKKRDFSREGEKHLMYSMEVKRQYSDELIEEKSNQEKLLLSMEDCMKQLVDKQKQCVQLFYIDKMKYEEVSKALEITWSQTRSFIQNGRRNLKKCMENNHE